MNNAKNIDMLDKGKLPIRNFQLEDMEKNATIIIIAKRGSGKSFVTREIMKHYNKVPVSVVISPSDKESGFFRKFYSDTFIHYDFNSELIQRFICRQRRIIQKQKQKIRQGKYIDARACLIMDDCMSSKKSWINDPGIRDIFLNGRHLKTVFIITMQYIFGITPELRTNIDYIFLLADDNQDNIKKLYKNYAGIFPSVKIFEQVFRQLTTNHGCMVICNRGAANSFLDKVFWYKAPISGGISIGCKQLIKFHDRNYDKKWYDNEMKQFDINEYCNIKNRDKSLIKIEKTTF
jgi:hypothetical protein